MENSPAAGRTSLAPCSISFGSAHLVLLQTEKTFRNNGKGERERERERCLIGKGLATEQLQVEVKDRWEKGGGGKVQARPWMHKVMPKFNLIDEKTGNRAISSLLKILQYVFTFFVLQPNQALTTMTLINTASAITEMIYYLLAM